MRGSASSSRPAALERRLSYAGPALFSYGFRPFFLGGAAWSAAGIALWIPQFTGDLFLPTAYAPIDWHTHEMLYGYVAAVIAGFQLLFLHPERIFEKMAAERLIKARRTPRRTLAEGLR